MAKGTAPARVSEGSRTGEPAPLSRVRVGRPKGSKNRPKGLLPTELAHQLLLKMEGSLPPDQMEYLRKVVKDGKAISTENELRVIIAILGRNLLPALVGEMASEAIGATDEEGNEQPAGFRRDVTERLKVYNSLLNLLNQVEKRKEDEQPDNGGALLQLWASRKANIAVTIVQPFEPEQEMKVVGPGA